MILKNPYNELEKAIGYRFSRKKRIEEALTHPSFSHEQGEGSGGNQRLEFLGDAALGLVVASRLYKEFPASPEGDLTRMRSAVTSTRALAAIARKAGIGDHLKLGRGEQRTGGRTRESNLADALEALIGAAFLDGGPRAVEKIYECLFRPYLVDEAGIHAASNPKGTLQELVQQALKTSPTYRVLREEGPSHSRVYTVSVMINGVPRGTGTGSSKQQAESDAARKALEAGDWIPTHPEAPGQSP